MRCLIFLFCMSLLAAAGCDKDREGDLITATIVSKGGCYNDSWIVQIDNPSPSRHAFICDNAPPLSSAPGGYNCSNAAIIRLPVYAAANQKISFRLVKDEGIQCLSYSFGAHHIKVKDLFFL